MPDPRQASAMSQSEKKETLDILSNGTMDIRGQFLRGSNIVLFVRARKASGERAAVYKPIRGENPLWDFPDGTLAARETAAYLTSESLGWELVPPTVLRESGPYGPGSVQQFFPYNPAQHYFTFPRDRVSELKRVALFDLLINNADRKGSHLILAENDRLWLIDHGLTFHQHDKVRTVIWEFANQPIPGALLDDMAKLLSLLQTSAALFSQYRDLLSEAEIDALITRAERLLQSKHFPEPGDLSFPYPLL